MYRLFSIDSSFVCIALTRLIIMILSVIVLMFVVSLQVHSMYCLACHASFQASRFASERISRLGHVHVGVPVLWSFHFVVLPLPRSSCDRGPVMFIK